MNQLSLNIAQSFSLIIFRIISLLVGTLITYLGYKLFLKKITESAGGLQGEYLQFKLTLNNAAPGTFFALFGSFIICVAVFKKIQFENVQEKEIPAIVVDSTAAKQLQLPETPQ